MQPQARLIEPPPLPLAALMAPTNPAAPLEHGTKVGGEPWAAVTGAKAKTRSNAPVPIAILNTEVVLIGLPP